MQTKMHNKTHMSRKTAGLIVGAVTGAAAGTVLALVSTPKSSACRKVNGFTRAAESFLDTTGSVFLGMADMLR